MKHNLYILNSIEEFEDCKKEITDDDQIIYTSELLGLQLKKISCQLCYESFFKYLEVEDVNAIKYNCLEECYRISKVLDSKLADDLNKEFGFSFSIYGPFVYYSSVIIATVQILSKFVDSKKKEFKEVIIYNRKLASFFDSGSRLNELLGLNYVNFRELKTKSNENSKNKLKDFFRINNFIQLYELIKWRLFIFKNNFLNYYSEKHYFIRPLYDLKNFLKSNNNLKIIDFLCFLKKIKISRVNLNFDIDSFDIGEDNYKLYFTKLSKEIEKRKNELFGRISNLIKFLENKKVHSFSWGNSPCQFTEKSILISVLQQKYSVLGFQHGGSYVDQVYPYHYHSEFFRCTSFFSYGFRKKDLFLYQNEIKDLRVFHIGKKFSKNNPNLTNNEILYVPTNSLDLYQGGILRTLPNELLNYQLEILNTLNNENSNNYVFNVKPFPDATFYNSHFMFELSKFEKLNYYFNITLKKYLKKTVPGLIILDYPSTPLCEIIHLPIQIILHIDPVNPFTDEALKILNKRVHVCSSIDQVKSSIKSYLNNTLEHKNNDEYYRRYINPVH